MAYSGVQMLMEKLNQLITNDHIPLINHPLIIRERPQFQLLYDVLDDPLFQTLFINHHHHHHHHHHQDLQKVTDLRKRFKDATHEAQYVVDLFLSGVLIKDNKDLPTSLNLDDVMSSFSCVKSELTTMDSSHIQVSQSAPATAAPASSSFSRNSGGSKAEIIVGLDGDVELIRDKLVEDQKKVDVVSIVGMGGIGKTTLATKVFNDDYVKYHFHIRVWVTVSQTYNKRNVLTQILESICGQLDLQNDNSDSRLREMVQKKLMGRRYLIVIDDIWHVETWDDLKVFFPHDNNGSHILLTTRIIEVAKHANSDGLIHHVGLLNKEKSWELLCQKVFHGDEYPEWSYDVGMQIVENCKGLPLAVAVIAGVLAKEAPSEKFWVEIVESTGSYILGDQNRCLETLGLSYNHLPLHLRECLLYLGGFPEDYNFDVRICNLWNLQTLIYTIYHSSSLITLPSNISDLVNLRHLWTSGRYFFLPSIERPMKLQTIIGVRLGDGLHSLQKCFPYLKELTCTTNRDKEYDFKSLTCLERLVLIGLVENHITFPATLKTLKLLGCYLKWSDMSIIQALPNLQVLILEHFCFDGSCWNTHGQEFPQLKFLSLKLLNILQWEAYTSSFPCLRKLEILSCPNLEEIPCEIGEIPTLELIKIDGCRHSLGESVRKIQQEQHDSGNYNLNVVVIEERHNRLMNLFDY